MNLTLKLLCMLNKSRRQEISAAAGGRPSYKFKSKACIRLLGIEHPRRHKLPKPNSDP